MIIRVLSNGKGSLVLNAKGAQVVRLLKTDLKFHKFIIALSHTLLQHTSLDILAIVQGLKVLPGDNTIELVPCIVDAVLALIHLLIYAIVYYDTGVEGCKLVVARDSGGIIGGFDAINAYALFEGKDGQEVSSKGKIHGVSR